MRDTLKGKNVLVVEDEMLLLMMIEDMLGDLGCESIGTAATVDKALVLIETQAFDCAMVDMNLGGNHSRRVAEALAARGVPFIYSTGNTARNMTEGYPNRPVLKKPYAYEELGKALLSQMQPKPVA